MNTLVPLDSLMRAIRAGLNDAGRDPRVRMDSTAVPSVEARVADEVRATVAHVTNTEPWYQSRVTIGAIISMAVGVAAVAGYTFEAEDITLATNAMLGAGTLIGGLITLWGRWRARKPLGA